MGTNKKRGILIIAGAAAAAGAIAAYCCFLGREERPEVVSHSPLDRKSAPVASAPAKLSGSELPAQEPPVGAKAIPAVRDQALAAFVNPNLSVQERVSGNISTRIPRVKHEEDMPVIVAVLRNREEDDIIRNEAANLLRRSNYSGLTDCLVEILDRDDETERFRAFCVQHLWGGEEKADERDREKLRDALRSVTEDRHTAVRREALLALVRMNDAEGKELAVSWLTSVEGEPLRDLAIRCVRELGLKEQSPAIRKCLSDPREPVKIAAMVTLGEWRDTPSISAIKDAALSGSPRLKRAAEAALERIEKSE